MHKKMCLKEIHGIKVPKGLKSTLIPGLSKLALVALSDGQSPRVVVSLHPG